MLIYAKKHDYVDIVVVTEFNSSKTELYMHPRNYKRHLKEYNVWIAIKSNCYNSKSTLYKYFGAKGVKVCDKWIESFDNFLNDVGKAPSEKHRFCLIDKNKNYEPGNFEWRIGTKKREIKNVVKGKNKRNTSGYSNVFLDKKSNGSIRWRVAFCINMKHIRIGSFNSKQEAAEARNNYIIENNLIESGYEIEEYRGNYEDNLYIANDDIKFKRMVGNRYGLLTVESFSSTKKRYSYWNCKCDCGNTVVVRFVDLKAGRKRSCGCLKKGKNYRRNASGYKNISFYKKTNKYLVSFSINYKRKYLGCFDTKREAVEARNKYIIENNLTEQGYEIEEYRGD